MPHPSSTPRLAARDLLRPWGRLRVWQGGSGPVVLAVHGLGGSGRYWEGLLRATGGEVTVVAPDLAGFGRSDKPRSAPYDRPSHLDDLDAVVGTLGGSGRVVLVGHSLGGIVAALWAARNPERVAALALVAAPYPVPERTMPPACRRAHERPSRLRDAVAAVVRASWPIVTFPIRSRVVPRAVILDFARRTPWSYWATARSFLWDPTTEAELAPLRGLDADTLLLVAADDRTVQGEDAERWARLLPRAQRVVTTGGHQLLLRNRFVELAAWVREVAQKSSVAKVPTTSNPSRSYSRSAGSL